MAWPSTERFSCAGWVFTRYEVSPPCAESKPVSALTARNYHDTGIDTGADASIGVKTIEAQPEVWVLMVCPGPSG
jgi:hypothetical protein